MAQMERRFSEFGKTPPQETSPTFAQLLLADVAGSGSGSVLGTSLNNSAVRSHHDQEEDQTPSKKSVLKKVKERALKLRQSLSGKKRNGQTDPHDDLNTPPSRNARSEEHDREYDDEEEEEEEEVEEEEEEGGGGGGGGGEEEDDPDPEYLGAPMYESELAPEECKETARQHPRAIPVVSKTHALSENLKAEGEETENVSPNHHGKTMTEAVTEKLGPAYAAVSDATHTITSKIAGLATAASKGTESESGSTRSPKSQSPTTQTEYGSRKSAGGRNSPRIVPAVAEHHASPKLKEQASDSSNSSSQTWDKGVSVKKYLMNKLEPGEDEKALSKAISEAISPKKTYGGGGISSDVGVLDKMREAVSSLLRSRDPYPSVTKATAADSAITTTLPHISTTTTAKASPSSHHRPVSSSTSASNATASPNIPVFSDAHEVNAEENRGRILQPN